jgi:undecaprenyl-diphosphatase
MVDYFNELELGICLRINALSQKAGVRRFFTAVSRLGNWPAYVIVGVACAATLESDGFTLIVQSLLTAGAGILAYKGLKSRLVRERPYIAHNGIVAATPPLDRYSFPSGHTMHAVSLAASRVILGLHYPTDVVVGGILGATLAYTSLAIFA